MGHLVLKLHGGRAAPAANRDTGRMLQRLRRLKATLVSSTVEGAGADAVEVFTFSTAGLAPPKLKLRSPCLIGAFVDQAERLARLQAVAHLGIALAAQPLANHTLKEESMSKPKNVRKLRLGKHEPEARRVFDLARRLVNGEGPPEELRMPNAPVRVVPTNSKTPPTSTAWGVAGIGVALEMKRPYPLVEAMVISGYILFGIDWPKRYKTLHLPASLATAFVALERHFAEVDARKSASIVTISKPRPVTECRIARPPLVADQRPDLPALPTPEHLQLTHQPSVNSEESPIDAAAKRVR